MQHPDGTGGPHSECWVFACAQGPRFCGMRGKKLWIQLQYVLYAMVSACFVSGRSVTLTLVPAGRDHRGTALLSIGGSVSTCLHGCAVPGLLRAGDGRFPFSLFNQQRAPAGRAAVFAQVAASAWFCRVLWDLGIWKYTFLLAAVTSCRAGTTGSPPPWEALSTGPGLKDTSPNKGLCQAFLYLGSSA